MFGKTITLFKMFGFAVRIDLSWLIILVLVVWSLAGGVFPRQYEGQADWVYFVMGLAAALGLFSSIVFHELCHSLVARRYGLPMKGITLFLFGGVAEMDQEPPSPKAEFLMAIAGPISSMIVAGLFWGLFYIGTAVNWPGAVSGVLQWIGVINVVLVCFNLIPGFPLDGGRALRAVLWHWKDDLRWATQKASQVGAGFGMVLIGLGILSLLTFNPIGGLWWILIGMFIRSAAKQGYQQVIVRQMLQGEPVRRFMNDDPVSVSADITVHELVEKYIYKYHFKMFPVVRDDKLIGCVSTRAAKDIPRDQWDQNLVGDVAESCTEDNTVSPDADTMEALSVMSRNRNSRLMVVEDEHLAGIITLKDLLQFLSLKTELETDAGMTKPSIAPRQ